MVAREALGQRAELESRHPGGVGGGVGGCSMRCHLECSIPHPYSLPPQPLGGWSQVSGDGGDSVKWKENIS